MTTQSKTDLLTHQLAPSVTAERDSAVPDGQDLSDLLGCDLLDRSGNSAARSGGSPGPIADSHVRRGLLAADASQEDTLTRFHILHGHSDEISQTLAAEQARIGWTDLLVQIDPGDMPHCKVLRALERVAQEVAPYLKAPALQLM